MNKKICSLIIIFFLLVPILITTITYANNSSKEKDYLDKGIVEVIKEIKTNENGWVNETEVFVDDIVRFKITIIYHLTGIQSEKLFDIIITDYLPEGLNYMGNATLIESLSDDQKVVWDLKDINLTEDNNIYELEFDTKVTQDEIIVNKVNVSAMESCYGAKRFGEANATLISSHKEPDNFILSINIDGEGFVIKNPNQEKYKNGTIVTLTADPAEDWIFDRWDGDITSDDKTIEILMDSNKTVNVYFKEGSYQDTEKPFVRITKPKEQTLYKNNEEIRKILLRTTRIKGPIDIEVEAYDNQSGIEKVEFYIGDELRHEETLNPYTWTWNETSKIIKKETIKVIAYDNAGNINTSEITVLKLGSIFNGKIINWILDHPGKSVIFGFVAFVIGSWFISNLKDTPAEEIIDDSEDGRINKPPVAKAEGPSSIQINEKVRFDASDSYDPDDDQIIYQWDFGDGNIAEGKKVDHIYKQKGTYAVTLSVIDVHGLIDTTSLRIDIKKEDLTESSANFWIIAGLLGAILTSLLAALYLRRKIYV